MDLILLQTPTTPTAPASAYLLCFVPLAITIVGFIIFAFLTDRDATRPYMRFDPAKDESATAGDYIHAHGDVPDLGPTPSEPEPDYDDAGASSPTAARAT